MKLFYQHSIIHLSWITDVSLTDPISWWYRSYLAIEYLWITFTMKKVNVQDILSYIILCFTYGVTEYQMTYTFETKCGRLLFTVSWVRMNYCMFRVSYTPLQVSNLLRWILFQRRKSPAFTLLLKTCNKLDLVLTELNGVCSWVVFFRWTLL